MGKKEKETKQDRQEKYAFRWFIALACVLVLSIISLLAIQYEWFGWPPNRQPTGYDPVDPLTWALASLIGAALYLMGQIATYYPKIKEKLDPNYQNDFVGSTYWYASTLIRAPVLTVVILWLLMNLTIGMGGTTGVPASATPSATPAANSSATPIATPDANAIEKPGATAGTGDLTGLGLSLDFSKFPDIVNLGIAFILGFYGRVARKQLDVIAKYLFTKAWALAELGFDISAPDEVLLGETTTFKTEPKMDVVWSANPGSIGADSGVYTAPSKFEGDAKQVVILAYLRSEPSATYVKQVPLNLFRITAGSKEAAPEDSLTLSLDKKVDKLEDKEIILAEAVWECKDSGLVMDRKTGESVTVSVPKGAKAGTVYTITAACMGHSAEFKLTVAEA